jgi:membrane protease YdiL (CAAX protease family)
VDSFDYQLFIPSFSDGPAWRAALEWAGRLVLVVLVPWLLGYHLYQNFAVAFLDAVGPIRSAGQAVELLRGVLAGTVDITGGRSWGEVLTLTRLPTARLPEDALLLVPYHVFFVAIPEEFFYRGYFQTRLDQVFGHRWTILGARVGPGLLVACAFFAFGHSIVTLRWWHFATFFPGVLFGWLRARTGSTLPGALFHAWCNVAVSLLDAAYGIR